MKKDRNILLSGYISYSFEKEDIEIFFKGSVHLNYKKTEIATWIKSFVNLLGERKDSITEYLYSELKKFSGLFSIVVRCGDEYHIAADIIRSLPVFYGFNSDSLIICDNLDDYQKQFGKLLISNNNLEEYFASGYVYGNSNIFEGFHSIQAGELVSIIDHQIRSIRYFEFKLANETLQFLDLDTFTKTLNRILHASFTRMIEQTPNVNRWIVPLSGGHDSRLIVNYLYRMGLKNVLCFTYGLKDNEQSGISKQVATTLNYDWHFVEYTEQKWQELHELDIIDEYLSFAFNGVSTPHLQDFLAVYELKKRGIIHQNDVFVPGHTLDWLAGSNFSQLDLECRNKDGAVDRVAKMHTHISKSSSSPLNHLKEIYDKANVDPQYFQEYFNWQEKRTKFMVNSVRTYEFFGYEYRLPYWDLEVVDFWMKISDGERMGRKIFFEAEKNGLLVDILTSIPFFGKSDRAISPSILENLLRRILPGFLKTIILRLTKRKVEFNAGLNQIYALKASTVKNMLDPVHDFPIGALSYFKAFLDRFPFQIDYHFLTSLYIVRRQFDRVSDNDSR